MSTTGTDTRLTPAQETNARRIAEGLTSARLEARRLTELPGERPASLEEAYRAQDLAIGLWPDSIGGWKSTRRGRPDELGTYQFGPEPRGVAPIFASKILTATEGEIIDTPLFLVGGSDAGHADILESEIVVRLGRDAPPDKVEWTVDDAADLIDETYIGVEIASTTVHALYENYGMVGLIADFVMNFGLVIGRPIPDWRSIETISAECYLDDDLVGRGSITFREGPLDAFAYILSKCARRGYPLTRGTVVTTGVIGSPNGIKRAGQIARHVFEGLGEITCRTVPATPEPEHG